MMTILLWIVFGFVVGLLARAIMPGTQDFGFVKTVLLGVAGSFVGGAVASFFRGGSFMTLDSTGMVGSVLGALGLLFVVGFISDKKK